MCSSRIEHVAIANYIVERDALGGFSRFHRQTGGDSAHQRKTIRRARARSGGQHIDRPAAVVHAIQQSLLFEIGDVLVNCSQALQSHAARDLFKRRRIAVAGNKGFEKVEDFFLPASDSHGRIIANKKRIETHFPSKSLKRTKRPTHTV
jgi:hypothetical protein